MQEEYIKDEQRNLKKEYLHAQEEVKRIQSVPLVIGQFLEAVDQVCSTAELNYYIGALLFSDKASNEAVNVVEVMVIIIFRTPESSAPRLVPITTCASSPPSIASC